MSAYAYSITHHPLDESYYRMYLNEAMGDKFMTGMKTGFTDQMAKEDAAYAKYADAAKSALGKAQDFAGFIEKKTGLSPMLTVSLVAAGLTGGASSIPMAALMYFARKYYTKGLGKIVDVGVDTLADAGQKVFGGNRQQGQPQLQPEHFNFKSWLMTEEEKEGWGDWLAGKVGYGVGAVGGAFAAIVKNVYNTVASRMKELASFIAQNPRQAAKIALTIGLAAATGGVVGKLSKDVVNAVGAKIQSLLPQGSDLASAQQAIVPEAGAGDFDGGSAAGGDFGGGAEAGGGMLASIKNKLASIFQDDKPINTEFISDNPTTAGELQKSIDGLMQNYQNSEEKQGKIKQLLDAVYKNNNLFAPVPEYGGAPANQVLDTYTQLNDPVKNAAGELVQYGFNPSNLFPQDHYNSLETLKQTIARSLEQKTAALEAMKSGAKAAY